MEKKTQEPNWVRSICIGKGAYGTVNLAINKSNGVVFAVKSVHQSSASPSQVEALENEIRILKKLPSSPYVVEYLGDDFTTTSYRNLHMEYLPGGTVADVEDERILRSYTRCILSALKHVHSQGIVHCDVKGRNVLVGPAPGFSKLADFGSAVEIETPQGTERVIVPRGSPLWMAPEVIRREYQGPESDVWSLGCTVIEMMTGKPGWTEMNSVADTLCRIGYSDELPQFPSQLSELGRDFLDKCLRRKASSRWSCDQLLHHPFVSLAFPPPDSSSQFSSPRCILDWFDSDSEDDEEINNKLENDEEFEILKFKAKGRIMELGSSGGAIWESDGWLVVREESNEVEKEFEDLVVEERETFGVGLEYSDSIGIDEVTSSISDSSCSNDGVLPSTELACGRRDCEWENSNYSCKLLLLLLFLKLNLLMLILSINIGYFTLFNTWPMRLFFILNLNLNFYAKVTPKNMTLVHAKSFL